jgi:hypothetical protein
VRAWLLKLLRLLTNEWVVGFALPLVMSGVAGWVIRGSAGPHDEFYVVVAGIVPVLLLALMVELVAGIGRAHARDLKKISEVTGELAGVDKDLDEMKRLAERLRPAVDFGVLRTEQRLQRIRDAMDESRAISLDTAIKARGLVRVFFAQATAAEAFALFAIGAGRSSPFLALACVNYLLMLTSMLVRVYEQRFPKPT